LRRPSISFRARWTDTSWLVVLAGTSGGSITGIIHRANFHTLAVAANHVVRTLPIADTPFQWGNYSKLRQRSLENLPLKASLPSLKLTFHLFALPIIVSLVAISTCAGHESLGKAVNDSAISIGHTRSLHQTGIFAVPIIAPKLAGTVSISLTALRN